MDHQGLEARRHGQPAGAREAMIRRGVAIALVMLAVGTTACTRKTTLMERSTTTTTDAPDSTAGALRAVQEAWDAQNDAHAASLTLAAVRADLAAHDPAHWASRTEELLDSLGVGVETAGGPCALMVNVFVRSDPARGSWPALYWCDAGGVREQETEGRGMRLVGLVTQSGADSVAHGVPVRAAALFARTAGGRQEPMLIVWRRRPKDAHWKVAQTLGPDSLGGYGTGAFTTADTTVDLVTRTFRTAHGWDECATCLHVVREHRFRWHPDGFARVDDHDVPSTYATFVHFVDALQHDPVAAAELVSNPAIVDDARRYEIDRVKGNWRLAPATEEAGSELTFLRGGQEAWRVTFEPRGNDWVIDSLQPVARSLE